MEKTFIVDRIYIYRLNKIICEGNLQSLVNIHEKYVANLFDGHFHIAVFSCLTNPTVKLTRYQPRVIHIYLLAVALRRLLLPEAAR